MSQHRAYSVSTQHGVCLLDLCVGLHFGAPRDLEVVWMINEMGPDLNFIVSLSEPVSLPVNGVHI